MLMQLAEDETRATPRSAIAEDVEVRGATIDDALRFIKKARRVYVAVPSGYDANWDYLQISKGVARKHLDYSRRLRGEPFASRMETRFGETVVYLGSVYNKSSPSDERVGF